MSGLRAQATGVLASIALHALSVLSLPHASKRVVMTARESISLDVLEKHTTTRAPVTPSEPSPPRSAPIQSSRPNIGRGSPVAIAVSTGGVSDNRAADLLAAQLMQSATQPRLGGATQHVGETDGADAPPSAGYIRWYTDLSNRIKRALVFPRSRQLELDQGTTLLRFAIGRDGTLSDPPRVLRSSGFDDLDAAALTAVLRSAPFSPLPDQIEPGRGRISLTVPVTFWNPTLH